MVTDQDLKHSYLEQAFEVEKLLSQLTIEDMYQWTREFWDKRKVLLDELWYLLEKIGISFDEWIYLNEDPYEYELIPF